MSTSRILAASLLCVLVKLGVYAILAGGDPAPALCRWDCGWYKGIADSGYRGVGLVQNGRIEHGWSFFPVMPLLIAGTRDLLRIGLTQAATTVSSLCLLGMAVFGARYRDATRPGSRDLTWVLLLACMPFGFYFATGYSEAPYALFAFATLLALARRQVFAASVSSALLSASRPTGVWLAPAIGILSLRRAARAPDVASRARALLPALIAVSGLLAWMTYLAITVGDPLAFIHSQSGWGRHLADPFRVLAGAIVRTLRSRRFTEGSDETVWAVAGVLIVGWLAFRRRWVEGLFLAGTLLMALTSGGTGSMPRFVDASPVFLLVLGDALDGIDHWMIRGACLVGLAGLQVWLCMQWIAWRHFLV